jgi:hypothetical protein
MSGVPASIDQPSGPAHRNLALCDSSDSRDTTAKSFLVPTAKRLCEIDREIGSPPNGRSTNWSDSVAIPSAVARMEGPVRSPALPEDRAAASGLSNLHPALYSIRCSVKRSLFKPLVGASDLIASLEVKPDPLAQARNKRLMDCTLGPIFSIRYDNRDQVRQCGQAREPSR